MRKYFLLSAVALMAATSANATTDYAEVTAKATIEVANTVSCTDLDFGTIVVKSGNKDSSVIADGYLYGNDSLRFTGDILSVSGKGYSECNFIEGSAYVMVSDSVTVQQSTILNDGKGNSMSLTLGDDGSGRVYGTLLTVPAEVVAGEYTGTFSVTAIKQ